MNATSSPLYRGLPARLSLSLQLISAGLATYFWLTYSGPYRWLAELQMEWLDGYYAILTWAVTLLLLAVPLAGAFQVSRRLGVLGTADAASTDSGWTERLTAFNTFMLRHRLPLGLILASLGFLFFGARQWFIAYRGAALETLQAQALEAGAVPSSSHIEVHDGSAEWDAYIEWREGHSSHVYVPFISPHWEEGGAVAAVLLLNEKEFQNLPRDTSTFRGTLLPESLPTPVQVSFREAGFETSKSPVLSVGVDPRTMGESMGVIAAIAGVFFACGVALFMWQRRRA